MKILLGLCSVWLVIVSPFTCYPADRCSSTDEAALTSTFLSPDELSALGLVLRAEDGKPVPVGIPEVGGPIRP